MDWRDAITGLGFLSPRLPFGYTDLRGLQLTAGDLLESWSLGAGDILADASAPFMGSHSRDSGKWLPVFNDQRQVTTCGDHGCSGLNRAAIEFVLEDGGWLSPVRVLGTVGGPPYPVYLADSEVRLTFQGDRSKYSAGTTFDLFDFDSGVASEFYRFSVPVGTHWDVTKLYTTGEVTLLSYTPSGPGYVYYMLSDLDVDNDVDTVDLLTLFANWTGADDPNPDLTVRDGDFDYDKDIDTVDELYMLSQWTGALGAGTAAAVPEPAGIWIALLFTIYEGLPRRVRR
jgi:hypothetical protein